MKKIGVLLSTALFLTGCARSRSDNAYQEIRETRNRWVEIDQRVEDKREAYLADRDEITFTGNPEDLTDVTLEVTSGAVTLGLPRYYHFIQEEDQLLMDIYMIDGEEGSNNFEDIYDTLKVSDITFEDGTYSVYAEDYIFQLHMYQESIRRLRDDSGELLMPSHYVPEELEEQWFEEANREVEESD